jgi:hypothetical protein
MKKRRRMETHTFLDKCYLQIKSQIDRYLGRYGKADGWENR